MKYSLRLIGAGLGLTMLGFALLFAYASRKKFEGGYTNSGADLLDFVIDVMIVLGPVTAASGLLAYVLPAPVAEKQSRPGAILCFGAGIGCLAAFAGGVVGLLMGLVVSVITVASTGSGLEYIIYGYVMGFSAIAGAVFGILEVYLLRTKA